MRRWISLALAILCACASPLSTTVAAWLSLDRVRTDDLNGDGRPDVWRVYGRDGRVFRVILDVNFDGRSDVQEYYEHGVLVRRESDRNFDGRVDRADEFDATTGLPTRSVEDADFDGTADLLLLFRDGRAVFSQRADRSTEGSAAPAAYEWASGSDRLAPLHDPFCRERAIRIPGAAPAIDAWVGVSASGLPADGGQSGENFASAVVTVPHPPRVSSAPSALYSSRAPPALPL